jgi:hypothetical protein
MAKPYGFRLRCIRMGIHIHTYMCGDGKGGESYTRIGQGDRDGAAATTYTACVQAPGKWSRGGAIRQADLR